MTSHSQNLSAVGTAAFLSFSFAFEAPTEDNLLPRDPNLTVDSDCDQFSQSLKDLLNGNELDLGSNSETTVESAPAEMTTAGADGANNTQADTNTEGDGCADVTMANNATVSAGTPETSSALLGTTWAIFIPADGTQPVKAVSMPDAPMSDNPFKVDDMAFLCNVKQLLHSDNVLSSNLTPRTQLSELHVFYDDSFLLQEDSPFNVRASRLSYVLGEYIPFFRDVLVIRCKKLTERRVDLTVAQYEQLMAAQERHTLYWNSRTWLHRFASLEKTSFLRVDPYRQLSWMKYGTLRTDTILWRCLDTAMDVLAKCHTSYGGPKLTGCSLSVYAVHHPNSQRLTHLLLSLSGWSIGAAVPGMQAAIQEGIRAIEADNKPQPVQHLKPDKEYPYGVQLADVLPPPPCQVTLIDMSADQTERYVFRTHSAANTNGSSFTGNHTAESPRRPYLMRLFARFLECLRPDANEQRAIKPPELLKKVFGWDQTLIDNVVRLKVLSQVKAFSKHSSDLARIEVQAGAAALAAQYNCTVLQATDYAATNTIHLLEWYFWPESNLFQDVGIKQPAALPADSPATTCFSAAERVELFELLKYFWQKFQSKEKYALCCALTRCSEPTLVDYLAAHEEVILSNGYHETFSLTVRNAALDATGQETEDSKRKRATIKPPCDVCKQQFLPNLWAQFHLTRSGEKLKTIASSSGSVLRYLCVGCGRPPSEIPGYATPESLAEEGCETPDEFARCDGTFNATNGHFWCTECYILLGCPKGKAP